MPDPTTDPWADDPKVSAVRKFRQKLEAQRTLRESGGYGSLRVFSHGLSIGASPYVAGALGGIEAKLAGRPWSEGYRPAVEEERRATEAEHTLHPARSLGLELAGSVVPFAAAGPLASGEGIAGRLATRFGGEEAAAAASKAYQAAKVAGSADAAAAARAAALEASPVASRVLARGIGGTIVGTGQAATMGAIDTPGGVAERAAGAARAAPWGVIGTVLEPAVGEVAAARAASREAVPGLVERMRRSTETLRHAPEAPVPVPEAAAPAMPAPQPVPAPVTPAQPPPAGRDLGLTTEIPDEQQIERDRAKVRRVLRVTKKAPPPVEPPPLRTPEAAPATPAPTAPAMDEQTATRLAAMRPEIRDLVRHALEAPDKAELERRLMAVVAQPMSKEELQSVVQLIAEKRTAPVRAPAPPAANEPPPVPVGRPTAPPATADTSPGPYTVKTNSIGKAWVELHGEHVYAAKDLQDANAYARTQNRHATPVTTEPPPARPSLAEQSEAVRQKVAAENAGRTAESAPAPDYKLPRELAGAKPRYGYGGTNYTPEFESDVDKALYIVAVSKPSKRDMAYMDWLSAIFPDKNGGQIRALGMKVREAIKSEANKALAYMPSGAGEIRLPRTYTSLVGEKGAPAAAIERAAQAETSPEVKKAIQGIATERAAAEQAAPTAPPAGDAATEQAIAEARAGHAGRVNDRITKAEERIRRAQARISDLKGRPVNGPGSMPEASRKAEIKALKGQIKRSTALVEQERKLLGQLEQQGAVAEAPPAAAPAEPPPVPTGTPPKREPLSTPEDRALAELKRAQERAANEGRPMTGDESVAAYEAALKAERKARGLPEVAQPEQPFPVAAGEEAAPEAAPSAVAEAPKKVPTPQVEAMPGMTPLGITPAETPAAPPATITARQPLTGPVGKTAETVLPDGERVPVRYRVVEAEDLNPSHSHESFQRNPAYPEGVQGREYQLDETAKQQFEGRVARYDPKRALDATEEIGSGPPTVTPDGTVVAGNERTMMAQRVAATRPEQAAAYRTAVEERAAQFGISPDEIAGMKNPVLVREMTNAPENTAALRDLNRRSDVSVGKAKDAISDATTRARTLAESGSVHALLVDPDVGMKPGETLRAYAADPARGRGLVDELISAKVIEPSERAAMMDASGKLNEHGLDTIERTFEAAAIGDPNVLARARAQIPGTVNKLEHAVPALVRANGYEGWGLEKPLAEALDILTEAKALPGGELEGLLAQGSMFGSERSPQAVTMARALENASKNDLKLAAHEYARSAREAATQLTHDDLFGFTPKTPEEAFRDTFGKLGAEKPAKPVPKKGPVKPVRRDAGFATTVLLRPIVGGALGASAGAATGETKEQKIERAIVWGLLGISAGLAPEAKAAFFERVRSEAGLSRTAYRMVSKPTAYIREIGGKPGEYLAQQAEAITQRQYKVLAVIWHDAQAALKDLTPGERVQAKKWSDGRASVQNASYEVKHAGQKIRTAMDILKDQGKAVGIDTSPKQGRAYPQALNADGEEVLQRLQINGVSDPKVQEAMQAMVDEGIATDLADAAKKFTDHADALGNAQAEYRVKIKGIDPYLQSPRFHMPERYVDWENDMAWKASIRRAAGTVEAAREWGPRWEDLHTTLAEIGQVANSHAAAADIQGWLSISFGGVRAVDPGTSKLTSLIGRYEVITKLGNLVSWIPNRFQSLTNLSHLPASTTAEMAAKFPPFLREYGQGAAAWNKLVEDAERSGGVVGYTGIHELPEHTVSKIMELATRPFSLAQLETEREAAILAPIVIKHDIEALQRESPKVAEGLTKFLNNLTGKSYIDVDTGELAGERVRRLQTMGLSPQRVADAVMAGRRLKPEELEAAGFFLNQHSMFSGTVLSRPIWLSRNPALAPLFIFKGFALRQFEYIYGTLWKEMQQGNVTPMAKFVASTILAGEAYHIARDLVFGSDRSISLHALKADDGDRTKGIAKRLLLNMAMGGGSVMVFDLMYGLTDWVSGSVGNTVKNVLQTAKATTESAMLGRYKQIPRTVWEGIKAEVPLARQGDAIMQRIHAKATSGSPYIAYEDLRNDARRTIKGYKSREKDVEAMGRFFLGFPEFEMSPNTIPYRSAALAIQNNDPVGAGKYLAVVAKSGLANGQDVNRLVGNMRNALTSRGPLGGFSADDRDRYLKELAPDKKRAVRELQRGWSRTQERAISYALRQARAEIKAEGRP